MAVATYANKVANVPDDGQLLGLKRGNALGKKLRSAGSILVRPNIPHGRTHVYFLLGVPNVVFTPTRLVAFAFYQSDNGSPSLVRSATLRG
jgi:hypothetical protein